MHRSFRALTPVVLLALSAFGVRADAELFQTIPAASFSVNGESSFYGDYYSRHCGSAGCEFLADAKLPGGAKVAGIEINACNVGDVPIEFALLRIPASESGSVVVVAEGSVAADAGCGYTTAAAENPANNLVNSFAFTYVLRVRMAVDLNLVNSKTRLICGSGVLCPSDGERFGVVRVYYDAPPAGVVVPSAPTGSAIFP